MMEEQYSVCCDGLPLLSSKYPWLVAQNLEGEKEDNNTGDQIFCTLDNPLSHYRCRVPELVGRRIRGCFHGWVILSSYPDNVMWSLWNPVTSIKIRLPPLRILKDGDFESIKECCLSSPPNDSRSILLLTRPKQRTFVFCWLDCKKRKRLRWTEMAYAKQLKSLTGGSNRFLHSLTCCNGKVFALNAGRSYQDFVIQVDIVIKDKQVVITLLPFVQLPSTEFDGCFYIRPILKGCYTELFYIEIGFKSADRKTFGDVFLFRLDMIRMIWEEMDDLKDAIFFVNLGHDCSVFYHPAIASEVGGYIHILGKMGKVVYSYNVKDKTISLSSMPCLLQTSNVSLWECGLQGDHGEIKCRADSKSEGDKGDELVVISAMDDEIDINSTRNETNELNSHLLNLQFDVLKMIMELCVGVEYLNFRATCKHCQLAAPMIQWSNKTALRRLQTYSLVSPLLMVFDKHLGIITFTDPMFGDKYFIKTPQELIGDLRIRCSRYGWLLMFKVLGPVILFNPFTNDIRKLPFVPYLQSFCFSAPPTSPDCMVVGFSAKFSWHVYIHFVNGESSWHRFHIDFCSIVPHSFPHSFLFPTFYGRDIYTLDGGKLDVFRGMEEGDCFWDVVVTEAPRSCYSAQCFLVKCDQHLLLVIVDRFGESVEVFKLNHFTQEWEIIDGLGKHVIYICGTTCLCIEAKTPEMENKIYFPQLHSGNGKIVFYSLETCRFHTFKGRNIKESFGDFFGTKYHLYPHAWIEPSWS